MENTFILYAHCIPVKGAKRSTICDLQSGSYYFIPNDMYNLLKEYRLLNISNLLERYGEENREAIEGYIDLMVKNKSVFRINNPNLLKYFPELNIEFDQPSIIDNAIIDFDGDLDTFKLTIDQLEVLGCRAVLVRVLSDVLFLGIVEILNLLNHKIITHIDIILSKKIDVTNVELKRLFHSHLRLSPICIFESDQEEVIKVSLDDNYKKVIGIIRRFSKVFDPKGHCPDITMDSFVLNLPHYLESKSYNNCLNKKVFISSSGEVKNCPSMSNIFGNIHHKFLGEIIPSSKFKRLWYVKKDDIHVCKDCEFRYICSDCRVHAVLNGDIYSKPESCKYDPYSARWLV
ncbi:SPASM domain peptide maturase, grasp-with-spasm system [Cyclobacterium lianum]|uniref:SPASM domain peptide maturase, grasp-with-spasm system n=1 Tax=Cyclobacterium lianum TaxID=388280 RepID=A0A1M7PMP2_9BACT|nr:grasp-with-spasm system SPASM domain peptide maturase [Cyclobacterium lianum]SHN18552.1 SPASM domain peptide maturase, grasp-with-spasm system [Cyclobacterium lianum]